MPMPPGTKLAPAIPACARTAHRTRSPRIANPGTSPRASLWVRESANRPPPRGHNPRPTDDGAGAAARLAEYGRGTLDTMTTPRKDGAALFATAALALAGVTMAGAITTAAGFGPLAGESATSASDGDGGSGATRSGSDGDDGAVADPDTDPLAVRAAAAEAMAAVTSVQFTLGLTGEPIFVDGFESIALEGLTGQFAAPGKAQATLDVEVDGGLRTRIGAIAIDDEIWISNPVTGNFETLPASYDIDPARFFDPEGGWYPLIAGLQDVELVGVERRGGERWHVRGVAPAADVRNVTAGLVRDQSLPVDLWIHPQSSLVTAVELTTELDGGETHWVLELERYGDEFTIEAP